MYTICASCLLFLFIDFYSWSKNVIEDLSIAFYFKLLICIFFFFAMKNEKSSVGNLTGAETEHSNLHAPFHFSVMYITLWLGIKSLVSPSITISWYIGVFLIFGGFASFIFLNELIEELKAIPTQNIIFDITLSLSSKIFVFSIFLMAIYFFYEGCDLWIFIPFYEWNL